MMTRVGPPTAPTTGFDVPLDDFTQLVSEAVDSLPPAFGKAMTNVAIVIEEEHENADRFGHYQGHPLAAPRYRTWLLHPDKITIYRKTICEHCHSRDEVTAMVYRVVIHESLTTSGSMTRGCESWGGRAAGARSGDLLPSERWHYPAARTFATS